MGRAVTTSVIMVSILFLCIWGIWYTKQTKNELCHIIDLIIENASTRNQDDLSQNINKLSKQWDKNQLVLSLFVRHDELEAIEGIIIRLKADSIINAYDSMFVELASLKYMLDHIHEHEIPSLNTLL